MDELMELLNKNPDEMSVDELKGYTKALAGYLFQGMYDEYCKQVDNDIVSVDPFEQIKDIVVMFENEYLNSLKPKLTLVKVDDEEED